MPPWERYQQAPATVPQRPWQKYASPEEGARANPQLPGPSAVASPGSTGEERRALNPIADMFQAEQEYQIAARQGTSYEVRDPKGAFLRKLLGEAQEDDAGRVVFKTSDGRFEVADKAKHVVLRDPQTDKQLVFARDKGTEQNPVLSLGQVLVPGMATGPIAGIGRTATAPTRAAQFTGRAAEIEQDAAAFERAGVRPFGPAFSEGPVAATAKQITEVPILGAPTRNALRESLTGARDAAANIASRYGSSTTAREAGDVAQQGIERFKDARPADVLEDTARNLPDQRISETIAQPASATSLKSKQAALYERAWRMIPQEMQRGRAVEGTTRVMGNPQNTRAVLQDITQRNARMTQQTGAGAVPEAALRPVTSGLLGRMIDAVNNPRWTAGLQTLRDMRSEFRRLASGMGDTEKNVLKHSDLDRIQSAITEDMVALLQRNAEAYRAAGDARTAMGFERSVREFRRADRFTRLSMERLETIERLFKADSAETLARNITQAALSGGRGNEQMLRTLRRTLRPEEMSEIASSIISELGRPVGSARGFAQDLGFSVSSFLTKWQNMNPRAQALLFGGEHRQALNDLVRVVSRLANVEAQANTSRSFSNTLGIGGLATVGGALAGGSTGALQAALGAGSLIYGASVLLSRPSYVRWLQGYLRFRAAARDPRSAGRVISQVNRLGQLAKSDPALVPVYRMIAEEVGIVERREREGQERQPRRPEQSYPNQ